MTKDSLKDFVHSKLFAGIVTGIGIALVVICIFEAGVAVGYHQASFSSQWGSNYSRNFGGPQDTDGLPDNHLPSGDGAFGTVVSVSSDSFILDSKQLPEEKVLIGSDTVIRNRENTVTLSSLTPGTSVVVLGTPNNSGQIEAKLVRVLP